MAHTLQRASSFGAVAILSASGKARTHHTLPTFLVPTLAAQKRVCLRSQQSLQTTTRQVQLRHASSSSKPPPPSSQKSPSGPVIPRTTKNERLNPPPSTLPPILQTPTRQPGQSAPAYWLALGKSYLAFYKSGLKAVYGNYKAAKSVRQEKGLSGRASSADAALDAGTLTRGDWQLLRRAQADSKRLPVFALVLLVCGEFTVLILPLVGGIVPRTCWIPAQVSHTRKKVEKRRSDSFQRGDSVLRVQELLERWPNAKPEELRTQQLVHVGRSLGLYSKWWDTLWDYPPRWLLLRRVKAWEKYIKRDDQAIVKYGGPKQLDEEELNLALEDRGVDVLNRKPDQLRKTLDRWLEESERQSVYNLVLTRPNAWERSPEGGR